MNVENCYGSLETSHLVSIRTIAGPLSWLSGGPYFLPVSQSFLSLKS
jgi:hypothetical protein